MERAFIEWLRKRIPPAGAVELGIGDDAAVLAASDRLVITTDMLMEGVDFVDPSSQAERIGRKSLAVNLSDLAAMAARPWAAVISVALPEHRGRELGERLFQGLLPLAADFNLAIAGGDTNSWKGPLVISVTALGQVTSRGPLRRDGAKPGDHILVTGSLGGSILGRHFDFTPRVREALWLHEHHVLHAGIDISDGLTLDLDRLASASGCGAVIEPASVPISPEAERLSLQQADGCSAFEHALHDGEDFELILAVPPDEVAGILAQPPPGLLISRIGYFIEEPGLWQVSPHGTRQALAPRGYEHKLT